MSWSRNPCRLRRHLSRLSTECYGFVGPKETPNTDSLSAWWLTLGVKDQINCGSFADLMPPRSPFAEKANVMKTKTIQSRLLARLEGERGLYVKVPGPCVVDVKLKIFEPPRFFEAFLRGRGFEEAPDITSRICGICPVAYQMSAVHAMEYALGI